MTPDIALSPLDEARWGVRSARALLAAATLPAALDFCRANEVVFLVARCAVADITAAQTMERAGFRLMDTLLYFTRIITNSASLPSPLPEAVVVRPVQPDEAGAVRDLAGRAFAGYGGHYHADERLERAACDAVYADWAYRSCQSRQVADEVLVATLDERMVGFITLRQRGNEGDGPLYGVDPVSQGQGIGGALMAAALAWLQARGARHMVMSTQITNVASQKVWTRLGFEPSHAEYTFHKWFDE